MADATGTFDEVKDHDGSNIRKMLRMAVFIAPESADPIETLVDTTNELVIPDGYESVGILDKENAFSSTPSITTSETMGYGYSQTLRRDLVTRNTALAFTMLESRRLAFELYYGVDLSTVQATTVASGKNEIVFDEPDRTDTIYYRVLCLGADHDGVRTIYYGDFYPRVSVSDVAALASSETDPRRYGVTLGVDVDTDVGTGHRELIAGPGLDTAAITAMGFTRAT